MTASERQVSEVERLRAAILAHRAGILGENGLGAGVDPERADLDLWDALDAEDRR